MSKIPAWRNSSPVDIRVSRGASGWLVDFDQGQGISPMEYRRLCGAVAQLRHSLRGTGRILLARDNEACIGLAKRLGFTRLSQGINGDIWELKDA